MKNLQKVDKFLRKTVGTNAAAQSEVLKIGDSLNLHNPELN